jgi:hypothetical protein
MTTAAALSLAVTSVRVRSPCHPRVGHGIARTVAQLRDERDNLRFSTVLYAAGFP